MGRILDSLKRREPNGAAQHAEPEHACASVLPSTPAATDDDWGLGGADVPFIEVPKGREAATEPVTPAPVVTPTRSAPAVHFEPAAATQEMGEAAESYRTAGAALWSYLRTAELKALLLLPLGADGVPVSAILSLARALHAAGCKRLLLIDTDVSANRLASELDRSSALGWSALLAGLSPGQVVQATDWPGLDLVPAGPPLAGLVPAVELQKARTQLGSLTCQYDLVLLLATPWERDGLPSLLVHATPGTCLLTNKRQEAVPQTDQAAGQLLKQGVNVVGSMLLA